jgi:uncharacterized membrane protein YeaQ/YmgE (transglycosylase-associated protein family)
MEIILWIILGALAGWIAGLLMKSSQGLVINIILGIIGAFIGGFLMTQFGQSGVTGFNFYSLFVAVLGAVILIGIGKLFNK